MNTNSSRSDDRTVFSEPHTGSWDAAFLAGLPHLLLGLLIGFGMFTNLTIQLYVNISNALAISLGFVVLAVLVYAWRRGWPLWSASWYFYGSWVSLAIIALGLERLQMRELWRYSNAINVGWLGLCILGYFVILTKSRLHGLLSVAFIFPMLSILIMEHIPNPIEGWLGIVAGVLGFLVVGSVVRSGDFYSGLRIVLGANLAFGLTWAYISEYKALDLPSDIPLHVPQFTNFLVYFAFYSIFGIGVVAIPFILRGLWNYGRRRFAS